MSTAEDGKCPQPQGQDLEVKDDKDMLPYESLFPAVFGLLIMSVVAIVGNLLVIVSYAKDTRLRTINNIYILNLAICDLIIGTSSMNFYLIHAIHNFKWKLGDVVCKIYLVSDYLMCTQSVALVLLIGYNHLLMLRRGSRYAVMETRYKAYVKVAMAWVTSFLLYGPAILGWESWVGCSNVDTDDCEVEFVQNIIFNVCTSTIEFLIPFVVLCVLNAQVYLEIRRRCKILSESVVLPACAMNALAFPGITGIERFQKISELSAGVSITKLQVSSIRACSDQTEGDPTCLQMESVANNSDTTIANVGGRESSASVSEGTPTFHSETIQTKASSSSFARNSNIKMRSKASKETSIRVSPTRDQHPEQNTGIILSHLKHRQRRHHRKPLKAQLSSLVQKDRKASRVLFLFVFVFLVTWAPYSITTVVKTFARDYVNEDMYEVFTCLLWLKSSINPFLYAAGTERFRRNFIQILKNIFCSCSRRFRDVVPIVIHSAGHLA